MGGQEADQSFPHVRAVALVVASRCQKVTAQGSCSVQWRQLERGLVAVKPLKAPSPARLIV